MEYALHELGRHVNKSFDTIAILLDIEGAHNNVSTETFVRSLDQFDLISRVSSRTGSAALLTIFSGS